MADMEGFAAEERPASTETEPEHRQRAERERAEVDRVARLLCEEADRVERRTGRPFGWADLARAVVADRNGPRAPASTRGGSDVG